MAHRVSQLEMRGLCFLLLLAGLSACVAAPRVETPAPFAKWRAQQVLEQFQNAGLGIEAARFTDKGANDGFAILMVVETKRFRLPVENVEGVILAFGNEADQLWMYEYYARFGETNPRYAAWLFTRGNVLVEIDRALPPARAREFQRVLNEMK